MNFSVFDQVHILILSAFLGCISGVAFLIYGFAYHRIRNRLFRLVCDATIGAVYSLVYFLFVVTICRGRISVFQLVFFFAGVYLIKEILDNLFSKVKNNKKHQKNRHNQP